MQLYQPTITGSLSISGSILLTGSMIFNTGSISGTASYSQNSDLLDNLDSTSFVFTSSYNPTSASFSTRTTTLEAASASFAVVSQSYSAASGSFSTRVTTIESKYATTGSNIFTANQTICGNLTTTGTITAQTINVQQVTSSIVYSSGSNIFGNLTSDVQQMTGSLRITGSGVHYIQGGNFGIGTCNPSYKLEVVGNTSIDGTLNITNGNNLYWNGGDIGITNSGYCMVFKTYNGSTLNEVVRITSTGIACFSNTVCAPTLVSSGKAGIGCTSPSNTLDVLGGTAGSSNRISLTHATSAANIQLYTGVSDGTGIIVNNNPLWFQINSSEVLRITSTGVACFACQVCAPEVVVSNSTVAKVNVNSLTDTSYSTFYHSENGTTKAYWEYINSNYTDATRRCYLEAYNQVGGFSVYTGNSKRLDITSTGIACFACQVCATSFVGSTVDTGVGTKTIVSTFERTGASTCSTPREVGIVFKDGNNPTIVGGITGIRFNSAGNYYGGLRFYVQNSSGVPATSFSNLTEALTIDYAGASTFTGPSSVQTITSTNATTFFVTYNVNTSTPVGYIGNGNGLVTSGGTNNFGARAESDLIFAAGGNNERMRITSAGLACFSCRVCTPSLQVDGVNFVEMATFAATTTSATCIVSNNGGYVQFQERHNTNTGLFIATTDGIRITKPGMVYVTVSQDIITSCCTGYTALYIQKNKSNISENLITNTNGQWDGINGVATATVAANDCINFCYSSFDITSFDGVTWSNYSLMFAPKNY